MPRAGTVCSPSRGASRAGTPDCSGCRPSAARDGTTPTSRMTLWVGPRTHCSGSLLRRSRTGCRPPVRPCRHHTAPRRRTFRLAPLLKRRCGACDAVWGWPGRRRRCGTTGGSCSYSSGLAPCFSRERSAGPSFPSSLAPWESAPPLETTAPNKSRNCTSRQTRRAMIAPSAPRRPGSWRPIRERPGATEAPQRARLARPARRMQQLRKRSAGARS